MFKIELLRSHELMTALILINLNFIRETSQENYLCPSGFAVCVEDLRVWKTLLKLIRINVLKCWLLNEL